MRTVTMTALSAGLGLGSAQATSPPDSWSDERIIECDGAEGRVNSFPEKHQPQSE